MRTIENLVFEGGGVLGMAYAGAIEVLEQKEVLPNVQRVAGTSAGALVAMILSLGYDAKEIKGIMDSTDFKKFEDHWDPLRIATKYGLHKGEFLLDFIENIVTEKTGNANTTFRELMEGGGKELKVFACDLNTSWVREFSLETTPEVSVAQSVRASMSIPLFFSAWQFPNNNPDNHIYVDGGTIYNYPLEAFGKCDETIGFFFKNEKDDTPTDFHHNHILKYVEVLFKSVLNAQKIDFMENEEQVAKTVFINPHGISPVDFKLDAKKKETLFNAGRSATMEFLNDQ